MFDSILTAPTDWSAWDLLDLAELVAVAQDEVHVLVKGLEGADEDAAVLQDAPHPEVDVLQHLAALPHRLDRRAGRHTHIHYFTASSVLQ